MPKPAVFAIVDNESQARQAVGNLEAAGFIASDISVVSQTSDGTWVDDGKKLLGETGEPINGKTREVGHTNSTKAPEGATAGVTTGGVLGGVAGWLMGIGALAIPGVGPFIAAGPILAALSGAAVGAAAGGIVGGLIGFGIPEYEAKLYAGKLHDGHILIGVHTVSDDEAKAAQTALEKAKAHDVHVSAEIVVTKTPA